MSAASLAAIFGTSLAVSVSGALSPGPLSTLAVRESVRRGFWAGPALAVGHGAIELPLVVGLALGLSEVLDDDAVTAAIALVGGAFLVWMGVWTVAFSPGMRPPAEHAPAHNQGGARHFALLTPGRAGLLAVSGIVVSVSNPFWLAWWATVGAAYISEALEDGAAGVTAFYSAHILTDIAWLSLIAFVLASGRRLMTARAYRGILTFCGLLLVGLGGWFLYSGITEIG